MLRPVLCTIALLTTTVLLAETAIPAQVFRWIDQDGAIHFGDQPTPGSDASAIELPDPPSRQRVEQARREEQQIKAQGDALERQRLEREARQAKRAEKRRQEQREAERERQQQTNDDANRNGGRYYYRPLPPYLPPIRPPIEPPVMPPTPSPPTLGPPPAGRR